MTNRAYHWGTHSNSPNDSVILAHLGQENFSMREEYGFEKVMSHGEQYAPYSFSDNLTSSINFLRTHALKLAFLEANS